MCPGENVRQISRTLLLPVLLAATMSLTACGTAPWTQHSAATPTPTHTASHPTKVQSDLSKGRLERTLKAGGVTLDVTYWSTLSPAKWMPAADKPLFVSFVGTAGSTVYASSIAMTAVAYRGGTPVSTKPIAITDTATVQPGYTVSTPYSYTGLFTIPAMPVKATKVIVQFTYVLLQAAPPEGGYAKSTTIDTLTLGLAD